MSVIEEHYLGPRVYKNVIEEHHLLTMCPWPSSFSFSQTRESQIWNNPRHRLRPPVFALRVVLLVSPIEGELPTRLGLRRRNIEGIFRLLRLSTFTFVNSRTFLLLRI